MSVWELEQYPGLQGRHQTESAAVSYPHKAFQPPVAMEVQQIQNSRVRYVRQQGGEQDGGRGRDADGGGDGRCGEHGRLEGGGG